MNNLLKGTNFKYNKLLKILICKENSLTSIFIKLTCCKEHNVVMVHLLQTDLNVKYLDL